MKKTAVLTSIYHEFWGTEEFRKSCARFNLPVRNAWPQSALFTGHGTTFKYLYSALLDLAIDHEYVIYADGADSLFVKDVDVPEDHLLYSTEKAIWPPTPEMQNMWNEHYDRVMMIPFPSFWAWKYLNGGGWCGPIKLALQFFREYGLIDYTGDINGQREQAIGFVKAHHKGFPIRLDTHCKIFQTTGFEHPGDFDIDENGFKNLITGTYPSILHGNGRTDMSRWYKHFNK